jgi:HK97 family phage major capsid protein
MNLPALKEQRAAKTDALRNIIDKAANENRDLNDSEQKAFDTARADIEKLEKDIRNQEFLADCERRMDGVPVANGDKRFESECREFSLRKAICSQIPGLNVDAGRELEISRELERRNGQSAQGIMVPMSVFEKRVVTTTSPSAGPGGTLTPMEWGTDLIDILRAKTVVRQLGATVLNGLTGNVALQSLSKSAVASWVAENASLSATDPEFDSVAMVPKHMGVLTEISRNMVMQTSPDVETILRNDFAQLLAAGLDTASVNGSGPANNQPTGILNYTGVGDVPVGASGGPPTWALVLSLINAVSNANALSGSLAFLTNSKAVGKMATVLKTTSDTSSNFIIENPGVGSLAGFPLATTNLVPSTLTKGGSGAVCSALIFGDWGQLIIGVWSALDILVNPYESTAYSKGNVQIRGMMTVDIALRQPAAFAKIADLTTT